MFHTFSTNNDFQIVVNLMFFVKVTTSSNLVPETTLKVKNQIIFSAHFILKMSSDTQKKTYIILKRSSSHNLINR